MREISSETYVFVGWDLSSSLLQHPSDLWYFLLFIIVFFVNGEVGAEWSVVARSCELGRKTVYVELFGRTERRKDEWNGRLTCRFLGLLIRRFLGFTLQLIWAIHRIRVSARVSRVLRSGWLILASSRTLVVNLSVRTGTPFHLTHTATTSTISAFFCPQTSYSTVDFPSSLPSWICFAAALPTFQSLSC